MITPRTILITITLDKALHSERDGVNTLHVSRWKVRSELNRGFLLIELAVALVIMGIAMVATLHLINGVSHLYTQTATTTSLVHVAQWVGEQDTGRRDDRNDACEVMTYQLPAEMVAAGNDPFSWVMRHVAVNKVVVHSRHDMHAHPLEMMVVKDG